MFNETVLNVNFFFRKLNFSKLNFLHFQVLTAAHCTRDARQRPFAARQFTVRLGDIDLSVDHEPSDPVTYKVKEIRAHPRFSRVGFYNDIASKLHTRLFDPIWEFFSKFLSDS